VQIGNRNFLSLSLFCYLIVSSWAMAAESNASKALLPVGIKQIEFIAPGGEDRFVTFALFYPAALQKGATPYKMPLFSHLDLYRNAPPLSDGVKRPLVIFSHGRGSSGPYYAWFAEYLAARGYIVATVYHYRANTYDATIMYLANKIWQRPVDISLIITFLLENKVWGPLINPNRIGVAGHSQGGFTALWIGGAKVNKDKFLDFQRVWINNAMVPEHLRKELPLDAEPAMHVHDDRVKAVFAMAPGDIQGFGMDKEGLQQLKIPTYIIVGSVDTQAPVKENAKFAAKYIPNVKLEVIPGPVDHEIFVNQCNQIGIDAFPEACVDAPGVDRAKLHEQIGQTALKFFDTNLPISEGKKNGWHAEN